MKTLKFDHQLSQLIAAGKKTSTWRLFDDKDLSLDDDIKVVDKVNPHDSKTWRIIGQGKIRQITEKKLGDVTSADMRGHEAFNTKDEMLQTYKGYYGNRVTLNSPVKIVEFDFMPTSGEAPTVAMLLEEAKVFTDGGSRGNPGESACGYAICSLDDNVIEKAGFYLGIATNNQAEYYGFLKALERARELGINKVRLFSDSQLVVNQMNGIYKLKNQELIPINQDVRTVAESFEKISFTYIPRELNKLADQEVNRILDERARKPAR